jgi:hypothetical protein
MAPPLTNAIVFPSPPRSVGGTTAPIIDGGNYPSLRPTVGGRHPANAHSDVCDHRRGYRGGNRCKAQTGIRGGACCKEQRAERDEKAERVFLGRGAIVLPLWGVGDAFGASLVHAEGWVVGSLAQFFWGVNANPRGSIDSNAATCPISLPPYSYQRVEGALPC